MFKRWIDTLPTAGDIEPSHQFDDSDSDESLTESEFERISFSSATLEYWRFARFEQLSEDLSIPLDYLLASAK